MLTHYLLKPLLNHLHILMVSLTLTALALGTLSSGTQPPAVSPRADQPPTHAQQSSEPSTKPSGNSNRPSTINTAPPAKSLSKRPSDAQDATQHNRLATGQLQHGFVLASPRATSDCLLRCTNDSTPAAKPARP